MTNKHELEEILRYAMQVKISASGNYMMAEIEEKQLEIKIQAILSWHRKKCLEYLGEKKEIMECEWEHNTDYKNQMVGYNQAIDEIRKRITNGL